MGFLLFGVYFVDIVYLITIVCTLIQKIIVSNRIYYGWVIVFVMAVSSAVSMGMGSLNFGLYIKPMGEDLSIGRAAFGWASTARGASGAITGPIIGRLLDKYGARWLLAVSFIFA